MNLNRIRAQFPILEHRNYLNSCSLGALSIRAEERLRDFLDRWHDMGASAWYEHWWGLLAELRRRIAALFAAPAGTIALMPSTSACLAVISESLEWSGRNRIITTELDFPTLLYQWKVRPGVEMVVLESPDGVRVDPQQFEDAVDERTLAIATSHVFFTTGAILDLKSIAGDRAPGRVRIASSTAIRARARFPWIYRRPPWISIPPAPSSGSAEARGSRISTCAAT